MGSPQPPQPKPPQPTPSNHQGTCARIAAKSWITLSLWSSKGIPSTVLRVLDVFCAIECVCVCVVFLGHVGKGQVFLLKQKHTQGELQARKNQWKKRGWVAVFCWRHGLLKMCILYNFTWVVFKVAGGFYIQNESMYILWHQRCTVNQGSIPARTSAWTWLFHCGVSMLHLDVSTTFTGPSQWEIETTDTSMSVNFLSELHVSIANFEPLH